MLKTLCTVYAMQNSNGLYDLAVWFSNIESRQKFSRCAFQMLPWKRQLDRLRSVTFQFALYFSSVVVRWFFSLLLVLSHSLQHVHFTWRLAINEIDAWTQLILFIKIFPVFNVEKTTFQHHQHRLLVVSFSIIEPLRWIVCNGKKETFCF